MKQFLLRGSVSILAVVLTSLPAQAQKKTVTTIPFDGPEIVCHILHSLALEPIRQIDAAELDPKNTMIVVFGRSDVLGPIGDATDGLQTYRANGGSLFVASDLRLERQDLPIEITGAAVGCDPDHGYRKRTQCPMLTSPWRRFPEKSSAHPIFRFLHLGIATNCPSQVVFKPGPTSIRSLAEFPTNADRWHGFRRNGFQWRRDPPTTCIAGSPAEAPAEGRTLVIAGHGMFMNGMMLQKDNDNFAFTVNALQWLREAPDGGKRKRALFVVDGTVITDFDANLYPPPPIPIPTASIINRALRGVLKEQIGRFHDEISAVLIAIGTLLLLVYGAKKIMEARYFPDTAVPLFAGPPASASSTKPLIQRRQQDLMARNNFWEAARALVRAWFRAEFDIPAEKWGDQAAVRLQVSGWSWLPNAVRGRAEQVMRLAHSGAPIKVTRRELVALVQSLSALHQAIKADRLALLVDGNKVGIAERRNAHE